MIRNDTEYQLALKRLDEDRDFGIQQKADLEAKGYTKEQVERGTEPSLSYHAQLAEEVDWYEKVRRREIAPLANLTQLGRLLIGLRLANGLTQRDLAERLGVSEAAVSRDERNEYHGVTIEKAQRVLEAMGETVTAHVTGSMPPREIEPQDIDVASETDTAACV